MNGISSGPANCDKSDIQDSGVYRARAALEVYSALKITDAIRLGPAVAGLPDTQLHRRLSLGEAVFCC